MRARADAGGRRERDHGAEGCDASGRAAADMPLDAVRRHEPASFPREKCRDGRVSSQARGWRGGSMQFHIHITRRRHVQHWLMATTEDYVDSWQVDPRWSMRGDV